VVVVGGFISATFWTPLVLPAWYRLIAGFAVEGQ